MIKKIKNILIMVVILLSTLITNNVYAETDQLRNGDKVDFPYFYTQHKANSWWWDSFRYIERISDGEYVYCIQPLVHIKKDAEYDVTTEDLAVVANIDQATWKRIERIAYYGYGYNKDGINHSEPKWYVATQMMIWQLADPNCDSYFTRTIKGSRDDSILADEIAEINNLVDTHTIKPSISLPSKVVVGNTFNITDTNNVLSKYIVNNVNGGTVNQNGNSLSITPTSVGNLSFEIRKNANQYSESVKLYYAVNSQMAVRRGSIDPIKMTFNLEVIGGEIAINKKDYDTGLSKPKTEDATLKGAIYGIYQSNGTKVAEIVTDENGYAKSDYLPNLGDFYIQEISPSNGYELDKTKYPVTLTNDNLEPTIVVKEKIKERTVTFFKVYATDETTILTPEPNITFDIFLKSTGEKYTTVTTDEQGYASMILPFGTYIVKQINTTPNYEKIKDFEISIKDSNREPLYKLLSNSEITAKLKVIKRDSETNKIIPISGIKFKIKNSKTNEYICQTISYPSVKTICEYETDKDGILYTPFELPNGNYELEEIDQKVDGYIWNKQPLTFEIGKNSKIIDDKKLGPIVEVSFKNNPVKGKITINKKGEELKIHDGTFEYIKINLEGVTFEIHAKEDIIINGHEYFKKGELVDTLITDEEGHVDSSFLPLGKYTVKETKTILNHVLDKKEYDIELKYKDQYTEVVVESLRLQNFLPKGKLEFTKTDISESKALSNTKIEIYTDKDELIFSDKTDNQGKVIIDSLPVGKFYILEKEAPEGYLINEAKMYFEIKRNGEVVKSTMKDDDITGSLEFTKIDVSTGQPLPNTLIEIYSINDELIFSGKTDENGKVIIDKLKYGDYYILEKEAPEGYNINSEKMYFSIKKNGEIVKATMSDEQIIKVPLTDKTDYKILQICSALLILIGIGILAYDKHQKK